MKSPTKKGEKRVKAWAVMNIDLDEPCVFVNEDTNETMGAAIFTSDWEGHAEHEAREWRKKNNLSRYRNIKVLPITITYSLPKKHHD